MSDVAFPASTPARRPVTGLGLLIVAFVISLAAYATAGLGLKGRTPHDFVVYAVVFCAAFVTGWVVVRFAAPRADPVLYPTATALAGLGIAMLYRIMVARAESTVAREQAIWLLVGLAALCATLWLVRDDRQLNAYTYTLGLVGVVLLLLPVVPGIGREINGARLWTQVGPFSFQPAEFGKIFIVVFLASYLTDKQELLAAGAGRFGLPRAKDLGPLLLAWGGSLAVLFLERDMGASLLFFGVFVVMLWIASGRAAYLWIGLVLFAAGAWFGYLAFDHVQTRVDTWLHALDPGKVTGTGYFQLAQGWFAMATGGIVGTGLGQGSPTLIPYVGSDFIFAAFGEELGMIGAVALLLLYLILIARGLRIAMERTDTFGKLLATGLTTILALQTFTIVAGVTRLIPLTGVPLPLVSYGGSSRVATFIMLALLIRVSSGPMERPRG
ncbi:MAG: FtsW/RodA/SpoVE family cell cycle protein [Actinomycetota bacterium]